jgi:hypothetical protein
MCKTCDYNVDRYGWDPNQARLIRAQALLDYQQAVANAKQQRKRYWQGELAVVAMVIGLILFMFILFRVLELVVYVPMPPAAQPATLSIEQTIRQVDKHIRNVNFDDKINCIDYAVVFYEWWPDSQMIRIYDRAKQVSHLLNKVNGRYIEPQISDGDPMVMWAA